MTAFTDTAASASVHSTNCDIEQIKLVISVSRVNF